MQEQKIVVAGCHEGGWNTINFLLEEGIKISAIVSITKEQAEKFKVSGYKGYEDLSKKYNIPIYYARKYSLKSQEDLDYFKENKFDLLITGGWQRLYPEEI